jgi:quaternary ammonium compound-resistance protein SugE
MLMDWLYLILGGLFEVGFTTTLRFTDGFRNLSATAIFLVCVVLSLLFLEIAAGSIPLGTAYAIWTGIGAMGTVLIGMVWFGEPATITRGMLIVGIVGCAIGLKLTSGK